MPTEFNSHITSQLDLININKHYITAEALNQSSDGTKAQTYLSNEPRGSDGMSWS